MGVTAGHAGGKHVAKPACRPKSSCATWTAATGVGPRDGATRLPVATTGALQDAAKAALAAASTKSARG